MKKALKKISEKSDREERLEEFLQASNKEYLRVLREADKIAAYKETQARIQKIKDINSDAYEEEEEDYDEEDEEDGAQKILIDTLMKKFLGSPEAAAGGLSSSPQTSLKDIAAKLTPEEKELVKSLMKK